MVNLIILFLLKYCLAVPKYSWEFKSFFNYQYPFDAILNIAYPSSIAYYYITIVPPKTNYSFYGRFLCENVYESSLTVYNSNGLINENFPSINTYNNNKYNKYIVDNTQNEINYVLQRFYVNLDYYTESDLIDNLFKVYNDNNIVPKINSDIRNFYSKMVYNPLETFISWIAPSSNHSYSDFYFPGEFNGLFPDQNHYYLISTPGIFQAFKIKGFFNPEKKFPFIDFTTVNQKKVSTDNGLPFYEFLNDKGYYEIYILSSEVDENIILNLAPKAKILKWNSDNTNRALIFRLIDYTNLGIANITQKLTPKETKDAMHGFYPEIEILNIKI